MRVGICTLGCKVNMYESEYVLNLLKEHGYVIQDFKKENDIYIINTCTVTNTSDIKSEKMIRFARSKNKNACIVVMGCFVEAKKNDDLLNEFDIDIILGNKDKGQIIALLNEYFSKKERIDDTYPVLDHEFEDMFLTNFEGRTRAFVKIQDGCENFCSYCIIPFVRGKCRSKKFNIVLNEINELVDHGYQEIVLTGIHTGNYGVDLGINFSTLLREIVKIKRLKRLRISSIEITELTDEVLNIIKEYSVIVDHLHVPLQSGSDTILKDMNRKYDLTYFEEKIAKIRRIRPDIAITTDIIVGFPNETEQLFLDTISFAQKIKFAKIHVFPYSIRSNTVAADMIGQVSSEEKKSRSRRLIAVSKELEVEYMKKFVNRTVEVLIEVNKDGYSYGHTTNYLYVMIKGNYKNNSFVTVTIDSINYPYCMGIELLNSAGCVLESYSL